MFSFPRVSKGRPFQEYTNKIKWRFDKGELKAWKSGNTGFPLIKLKTFIIPSFSFTYADKTYLNNFFGLVNLPPIKCPNWPL